MDLKEFGRFVARLRHERGLTQSQLAEELGMTDKAVSRWERAVGFPDITLLAPLASALGVSVSELVAARRFDAGESSPVSDSEAEDIAAANMSLAERTAAQTRESGWLGGAAALLFGTFILVGGHANLGGSVLAGLLFAVPVVCLYMLVTNFDDVVSRRVYGAFMTAGLHVCAWLMHRLFMIRLDWYSLIAVEIFALLALLLPGGSSE